MMDSIATRPKYSDKSSYYIKFVMPFFYEYTKKIGGQREMWKETRRKNIKTAI